MDVATDFVMGIWVEVVATVGVATGGTEFTGVAGIRAVGMGWVITLYLYSFWWALWFFSSSVQMPWVLEFFYSWDCYFGEEHWYLVVAGFGVGAWVWDQAYPLVLCRFSYFG